MKLEEFEEKLIKMINESEIVLSRKEFRTIYLIDNLKLKRKNKLLKLFNPEVERETQNIFKPCECFMSICYYSRGYNCYHIELKEDIYTELIPNFKNQYYVDKYIKDFFIRIFEFKDLDFSIFKLENKHIDENNFTHNISYKNPDEDKILTFEFRKYKFDILNKYSYKQIVNLFKKK